ncbi:hypothetical protein WP39_01405 [Streptomyces sp. 604F]|nr:hypothetical protein [Streptomyces sp. 604F]
MEPARDRRVDEPFRQRLQHAALPGCQTGQRVGTGGADDQPSHDLRVDGRAAGVDALQGVEELLDLGDPVLEEVADPFGTVRDELCGVSAFQVLREDENAHLGPAAADLDGGSHALVGVGGGGIRMSVTTTSGGFAATSLSSDSAVPTAARTTWPSSARRRTRPSLSRVESSARMTRTAAPR